MDRPCPAYKREHNRFLREAGESRRMQSEHSDLIRIINKNAGVNATDIYEEDIGYTLDALNAQVRTVIYFRHHVQLTHCI